MWVLSGIITTWKLEIGVNKEVYVNMENVFFYIEMLVALLNIYFILFSGKSQLDCQTTP